nr:hypothetical protein [Tanacetum cinerariifolium]
MLSALRRSGNENKQACKNMLFHYKAGLSQVESRLAEFKNQEIKFCEKIRGLELQVEFKTNRIESLTNELELLKKEKEGLESKLTGFKSTNKDLDHLIGSQRSDKIKEGLGYSVVPPQPAQVYSPPIKDMSWTGLSEFADDTITILGLPLVPEIKFVKPADRQTEVKIDTVEIAKKPTVKKFPTVNKKFPTGNTKFSTADLGNKGTA